MASMGKSRVHYRLDPTRSRFTVQAFAGGLLAGFGHNPTIAIREFNGEADFEPETLAEASLTLSIKAASLAVTNEIGERDRKEIQKTMLKDVLETSLYPEILFRSTSITSTRILPGRYRVRIIGELTLHGVTRNGISITAQTSVAERELRAQGEFNANQTNFRIKPVSVAGGVLKLKDELKLSFDVVGTAEVTG